MKARIFRLRISSCIPGFLALLAATPTHAQSEINANGYLPSDRSGEQQRTAATSIETLHRFETTLGWDARLSIDACRPTLSETYVRGALIYDAYSAIGATHFDSEQQELEEAIRSEGLVDAGWLLGGDLAFRVGVPAFCRSISTIDDAAWMSGVIAKHLRTRKYPAIPVQGKRPLFTSGFVNRLKTTEAVATAVRCGLRDSAWKAAVEASYHVLSKDEDLAGHEYASPADQAALKDSYVQMGELWSRWQTIYLADQGCSTLAGSVDLYKADEAAKLGQKER